MSTIEIVKKKKIKKLIYAILSHNVILNGANLKKQKLDKCDELANESDIKIKVEMKKENEIKNDNKTIYNGQLTYAGGGLACTSIVLHWCIAVLCKICAIKPSQREMNALFEHSIEIDSNIKANNHQNMLYSEEIIKEIGLPDTVKFSEFYIFSSALNPASKDGFNSENNDIICDIDISDKIMKKDCMDYYECTLALTCNSHTIALTCDRLDKYYIFDPKVAFVMEFEKEDLCMYLKSIFGDYCDMYAVRFSL